MYYEASTNEVDKTYNIKLQLTKRDLEELDLDDLEHQLVTYYMKTGLICDKLIALEIVFRNIERKSK